ncbi:MAG: hypothetical protein JW855_06055, partial [Gammaproteobacteria bacterium]|nr:hypothetical protein [Gammaproteobacteria bacterium]
MNIIAPKNIENHDAVKYAKDITQICAPLLDETPIKNFALERVYQDGGMGFCTDVEWTIEFFKKGYDICFPEEYAVLPPSPGSYLPWDLRNAIEISEKMTQFNKDLIDRNAYQGVTIYETTEDCVNAYEFTIDVDFPSSMEYLLKNIDLFKNFIFYFKEKIHSDKKLTEAFYKKYTFTEEPIIKNVETSIVQQPFKVKKYYLLDNQSSFSKKELSILKFIALGQTSKQIAKNLNNSFRTIEKHLVNIKNKA